MMLAHCAAPHVDGHGLKDRVSMLSVVLEDVERQRLGVGYHPLTALNADARSVIAALIWTAFHPHDFG